jgi:CubicO group peptidase (beta-lactamase class C family)
VVDAAIGGWVDTDFERVLDVFEANFEERAEVGAAVCVYVDGRAVVDLWGGIADDELGGAWESDTVVLTFSSTKGVTAICANHMIEQGVLDPDARVAEYWPEFAAAGKRDVTVRQVLGHQTGLPFVEGDFTLADVVAWEPIVRALEHQAPVWEPGTKHGYHMRTYGWLTGEIARRADPAHRSLGAIFRDDIAVPLGLDFWIGLPEELEARVARLVPPPYDMRAGVAKVAEGTLLAQVFGNPSNLFNYDSMWNARALHAAEMPSTNGIGDARSLARLYASCIGAVDGRRTLSEDTLAAATDEQACGRDEVLMIDTCFGLGFMLGRSFGAANAPTAFGHAGAGGSLAFADPPRGLAFGYVMNDLRFDPKGDPRSEELVRAVYDALG